MCTSDLSVRTKLEIVAGTLFMVTILWLAIAIASIQDKCEMPGAIWNIKEYLREATHRLLSERA